MKRVRCAIYTRKSTDEGLEQDFNSLAAQREACEAYIKSQAGEGWRLLQGTYDDGGYSGGTMERPALQALLGDIDAGAVDVIVVYKVDRLTRALNDFSRIVERLDAKGASFVSVTQAFNTSTSMGRLTLNVLLSFAQFERELTGERIRDKLAASKKKGMWMGGGVPLGYAADGRTLAIVPEEAELVRSIFRRYIESGSLKEVADRLAADGVRSKRKAAEASSGIGGALISPGALRYTLSNRLYRGEIRHRDKWYPGLHPAIVDADLFDAVQARFANGKASRRVSGALLQGILFDDAGFRMSPHAAMKDGKRHHYYVSRAIMQSRQPGSLARVSAAALEEAVSESLARVFGVDRSAPGLLEPVQRITVAKYTLLIDIDVAGRDAILMRARTGLGEQLEIEEGRAQLRVPIAVRKWRGAQYLLDSTGRPSKRAEIDRSLAQAIARAHGWRREWIAAGGPTLADIARRDGIDLSYVLRTARLAYLAPDLVRAVLAGSELAFMSVDQVVRDGPPLAWEAQRRLYSVSG